MVLHANTEIWKHIWKVCILNLKSKTQNNAQILWVDCITPLRTKTSRKNLKDIVVRKQIKYSVVKKKTEYSGEQFFE